MPFTLNNITTADNYTAASTVEVALECPKVNLTVANAAIFFQLKQIILGVAPGGEDWRSEVFMVMGSVSLVRRGIVGIRVRSAAAGKPAQVTAEMVMKGEA